MEYVTLYSTLMDGIGSSLQDSLAAIWLAAQADLLAYDAIVGGLFVLAWSLLTWAALNSTEARADAKDERERLRVWTLILTGVDVAALSEVCPPPATPVALAATTDGETTDEADVGRSDAGDAGDAGRAA